MVRDIKKKQENEILLETNVIFIEEKWSIVSEAREIGEVKDF